VRALTRVLLLFRAFLFLTHLIVKNQPPTVDKFKQTNTKTPCSTTGFTRRCCIGIINSVVLKSASDDDDAEGKMRPSKSVEDVEMNQRRVSTKV
jgi:hypothetical protein